MEAIFPLLTIVLYDLIIIGLLYIIKYAMECLHRKKEPVLGFGVDLFTFEEALQYVHTCLKENTGMQIVTINPEMISLG